MQIKHLRLEKPNADVFITSSDVDFTEFATIEIITRIKQSSKQHQLIGLSGGSTPFPVYQRLSEIALQKTYLDKCFWFQVDERLSKDKNRSNQDKIIDAMFSKDKILRKESLLAVDLNEKIDDISETYSNMFKTLPSEIRPPQPIDLLIMGLGADGHTASLFPECDWNVGGINSDFTVFRPKTQPEPRISLKLERIIEAKELIFLVNSEGKHEALEDIFKLNKHLKPAGYISKSRHTNWIINTTNGYDWIDENRIASETTISLEEKHNE